MTSQGTCMMYYNVQSIVIIRHNTMTLQGTCMVYYNVQSIVIIRHNTMTLQGTCMHSDTSIRSTYNSLLVGCHGYYKGYSN